MPLWKVIYPKVDCTLSCYSKACTPVSTYRTLYLEHREIFSDYEPIFMDGSKSESHVGSALVSLSTVITDALPISASIYTAELHALRIAIEHILLSRGKKFIIYADSLSALQSIVSLHSSSHPILVDITYALANHLKKKDIRFCWIPGDAGITGNELADTAARSATGTSERFPIPHSDLKACFRQKLQSVWQSNWDKQTENKLYSVIPVLAPTVPSSSNRREQVIWTRLRLGHTRLTHWHLLFGEQPPYCEISYARERITHSKMPLLVITAVFVSGMVDIFRNILETQFSVLQGTAMVLYRMTLSLTALPTVLRTRFQCLRRVRNLTFVEILGNVEQLVDQLTLRVSVEKERRLEVELMHDLIHECARTTANSLLYFPKFEIKIRTTRQKLFPKCCS
ncbi:putative RNA-directed DNA polymerase from transposon X-element [Trichonephila clavata]|uniref:Putative RNA-directed DNA polymerase from transposon X-element n=1 Tax=Trichonephila clavata TaxID=2740835 RepID=A0A8X6LKC8_TRICU|nr:putative RNA-directed DNA polymerase from transposon X-element [Trichonephila clavata]